jgi:hypothetical protein
MKVAKEISIYWKRDEDNIAEHQYENSICSTQQHGEMNNLQIRTRIKHKRRGIKGKGKDVPVTGRGGP